MKNLSNFSILKESVFYKGWHILEYMENHVLTELDKSAIKATIMDALVFNQDIDPTCEFLDFENLVITKKQENNYAYEKYPNISGIPLWMKKLFRTKSLTITGGIPVSIYLSIPVKSRCIYDMNTSVSAFFENCNFYTVNYKSPTRPGKIAQSRPFVEIEIDGILYLVDNITRRIIRRDFFEKNYGFDIESSYSKKAFNEEQQKIYSEWMGENINLFSGIFYLTEDIKGYRNTAEHYFEIEESKKYFPEAWKEYEIELEEYERYKTFLKEK